MKSLFGKEDVPIIQRMEGGFLSPVLYPLIAELQSAPHPYPTSSSPPLPRDSLLSQKDIITMSLRLSTFFFKVEKDCLRQEG